MSNEATATAVSPAEAKPVRKIVVRIADPMEIRKHHFDEYDVSIEFRPLVGRDFAKYLDKLQPIQSGAAVFDAESEMVASRLLAWSVTDSDGKPVAITAENINGIEPVAFRTAIIHQICGL